jgi:hypothetical protein
VGFYKQQKRGERDVNGLCKFIRRLEKARKSGYKEVGFGKLRPLVGVLDQVAREIRGREVMAVDQILLTYSTIPHSPSLSIIDSLLPHTLPLPLPQLLDCLSSLSRLPFTPIEEYLFKIQEVFLRNPSNSEDKMTFINAFSWLEHKMCSQKYLPYADGWEEVYKAALVDNLFWVSGWWKFLILMFSAVLFRMRISSHGYLYLVIFRKSIESLIA